MNGFSLHIEPPSYILIMYKLNIAMFYRPNIYMFMGLVLICIINMFLKGYPLEAKTAPKN